MSNRSIQDSLSLINTFLEPVRAQAQKEATLKQAAEGTSFMTTSAATPENQMKEDQPATEQSTLGVEQAQAAQDSGSNVATAPENNDAAGNTFADTQGPQTLDSDEEVSMKTNTTEINTAQKVARAENLGNAILEVLYKTASEGTQDSQKVASEKTEEDSIMDKMAAHAAGAAQEYYEGYLYGMIKRAQDQQDLYNACVENKIDPELIQKAGGIEGILDKVAMEFPEAIMPEGALPEGGMEEGGMAEGGEEAVEQLADALDEAGVTAEELAQAVQDVQALQEAGISPDELAEVMTEVLQETDDAAMSEEG